MSAWIHRGDGFVGWGEAARLIDSRWGRIRFAAGMRKWLTELFDAASVADEVAVPGTGPVAFGSFTFDLVFRRFLVLIVPALITGRTGPRANWQTTTTSGGRR